MKVTIHYIVCILIYKVFNIGVKMNLKLKETIITRVFLSLIICLTAVLSGCQTDDVINPVTDVSSRAGDVDGVHIWQLPDAPNGSKPDQCWLAVGSDPDGNIYISGHDHDKNSILYKLSQNEGSLKWIGDAKEASQKAGNWKFGETAQKFHTRPIYHEGKVYVATMDYSGIDGWYKFTRGFHWYSYDIKADDFTDISAAEPNGVGAKNLQIVTIQIDPKMDRIYGMSVAKNDLVYYDILTGSTTNLGRPSGWTDKYFYTNRYMWIDSRSRVYISAGNARGQWNKKEDPNVFDSIWYYDPASGFGVTDFQLVGPNAIEVGQWDREYKNLYVSDDQGHIYRFVDEGTEWEYLGAPGFISKTVEFNANKTWVLNVSPDGEKIYIGRSDNGAYKNEIWEFDITTGTSYKLCTISELDEKTGSEDFITGYDSWDDNGNFYFSAFTMFDDENVYLMGVDPVRIKVEKGVLPELVEVNVTSNDDLITLSRTGETQDSMEIIYDLSILDKSIDTVDKVYGELVIPAGESELNITPAEFMEVDSLEVGDVVFSVKADGNDYVLGSDRNVIITR